jgi:hypothetical protein
MRIICGKKQKEENKGQGMKENNKVEKRQIG